MTNDGQKAKLVLWKVQALDHFGGFQCPSPSVTSFLVTSWNTGPSSRRAKRGLAPKSGAETRDFLRSKAEEGTDYVKRRAEDLRDTATDTIDRGKDQIRRHKDNLSAAVDAGKQAYREAVKTPLTD